MGEDKGQKKTEGRARKGTMKARNLRERISLASLGRRARSGRAEGMMGRSGKRRGSECKVRGELWWEWEVQRQGGRGTMGQ